MKIAVFILIILSAMGMNAGDFVPKLIKEDIENESFWYMGCPDSMNCFAITMQWDTNRIYRSTDQGDTWNVIWEYREVSKDPEDLGRPVFNDVVDTNHIYTAYNTVALMDLTEDGAKTFRRVDFRDPGGKQRIIHRIEMYNKRIGVVVFYGEIAYTRDNWKTFKIFEFDTDTINFIWEPKFLDSNNAAAINGIYTNQLTVFNLKNETISKYSEFHEPPPGEKKKKIYDFCFVNDSLGFGCGAQSFDETDRAKDIIWKTTDKGKHWEIIFEHNNYDFPVEYIDFKDELNGFATGGWGVILKTSDGGESWHYLNPPELMNKSMAIDIDHAGQYPIFTAWVYGIYRYEEATSAREISREGSIKIQQNDGQLLISIEDETFADYLLSIVDINGRVVQSKALSSGKGVLYRPVDISALRPGIYLYSISSGNKVKTGRFTVLK